MEWIENQQVHHHLAKVLYSKDNPITITPITQGLQQTNLLVSANETDSSQKYVIRVYLDTTGVGEMRHEREYEMLTWIRDRGHTFCPCVTYHDWSRSLIPYRFMVQEYISGVPMITKRESLSSLLNEGVLTKLVSLLKTIHKVERDPNSTREEDKTFYHHKDITVPSFEVHSKYISEDFQKHATEVWNRLWKMTLPYFEYFSTLKRDTLVHGDCYFSNIIDRGDHYYLVDWELACTSHPIEDLATFICSTITLTPDQEKFFLTTYGFDFSPENNLILWLYKIRRLAFIVGYIGMSIDEYYSGKRQFGSENFFQGLLGAYKGYVQYTVAVLDNSPIKS